VLANCKYIRQERSSLHKK